MLKPLKDRVVIQMVEQEEKTAGGLFLPTTAQEKITICKSHRNKRIHCCRRPSSSGWR